MSTYTETPLRAAAVRPDAWLGETDRRSPAYIRWVQASLNRIISAGLAVDGVAGRRTRAAVRSFQARSGLMADGIVGPRTEAALRDAGAVWPPNGGAQPAPVPQPATLHVPRAVAANQAQAAQLGWDILADAIAGWILRLAVPYTPAAFATAVAQWQARNSLPSNGILDYATWQPMLRAARAGLPRPFTTPEGVRRPHGLNEIVATFGNPTLPGWEAQNLVRVSAPAAQRFAGQSTSLRVHRLIAPQWRRVFDAIHQRGLWGEFTPVSGTFACRTKRPFGGRGCSEPGVQFNQLSTHSWGITIDIRPSQYPMILAPTTPLRYPPLALAQAFQELGFHWGLWFMRGTRDAAGRISLHSADPMHFQFATGY